MTDLGLCGRWKKCWGKTFIYRKLSGNLKMQRVRTLGSSNFERGRKQRIALCSREFLRHVGSGRGDFLDRIITTEETLLHYYDPGGKRESSVQKKKPRERHNEGKSLKTCRLRV